MSVPTGSGAVENDPGRPFIADDNGGQGVGPSLGGDLGGTPLPPKRPGHRDPALEDRVETREAEGVAPETPTYAPSSVEVDLGRQQGLGMGQRDLDRQKDPTGAAPGETRANTEPGPRVRAPDDPFAPRKPGPVA
jgi:hypothetical protein